MPESSEEMKEHEGNITMLKYIDDETLLSASGDKSIIKWDLNKLVAENKFYGHQSDVMCIDAPNNDKNLFISGGIDKSVLLWDFRDKGRPSKIFTGHTHDINSIKFHPSGLGFLSGSDDCTIRFYDLRADRELMIYEDTPIEPKDSEDSRGITSIAVSNSGKYLFSNLGSTCKIWNALSGEIIQVLDHQNVTVSHVGITPNGYALLVSLWSGHIKVYA